MQKFFRRPLIICLSLLWFNPTVPAAETTNEVKATEKTNELRAAEEHDAEQARRAYLQLQEQLHAAQLAIEHTRQEAGEAARRNAETVATRLTLIEQVMEAQRAREIEAMQKSNRLILTGAGIFGAIGVLALVFTAWFLLRAMSRLSQIAATFPVSHALAQGTAAAALGGAQMPLVGFSSPEPPGPRLLGAIERLEKRIHELEVTAHVAPAGENKHVNGDSSQPGPSAGVEPEKEQKISLMLGKGQALLHVGQPENALFCFDEALSIEPNHTEALLKKGTALERLKRLEEAIGCYDRAIAVNSSMTLAYLYKGGVFNQLERFSEALECYEQALRNQKAPVS